MKEIQKELISELFVDCNPVETYIDFLYENSVFVRNADWIIATEKPDDEGPFWLAAIGKLTDDEKKELQSLVDFLRNYKIKRLDGEKDVALIDCGLLAAKEGKSKPVEVFWRFVNGETEPDSNTIKSISAMRESMKLIDDLLALDFVNNVEMLWATSDPLDEASTWYLKITI